MHLAVDARMIRHAGIGVYLRNMIPRVVALRPGWRVSVLLPHDDHGIVMTGVNAIPCRSDIYSAAEQWELPRLIPRDADLLWSPHYNVPLLTHTPWVVTIHDVAHLARPEGRSIGRVARLAYARLFLSQVRHRARRIIFDSEFSRREFAHYVGAPRRSTVIHIGVDASWFSASSGVPTRPHDKPYVLFVGSVKPHKNLRRLLQAFGLLATRVPHDLIIIGAMSGMRTVDLDAIEQGRAAGDRVRFVGHVDDATLRDYMKHADALAFPSLYEGFGLPPLEAMASGVPVVVADIPVLCEVCGDAAEFCDPLSVDDIAEKLAGVLGDASRRAVLVARGRDRAAALTWDTAAEQTAAVLEQSAGR